MIEEAATDRIPTIDLLRALVDLEEGPWARWWLLHLLRHLTNREGTTPRRVPTAALGLPSRATRATGCIAVASSC